MLQTLLNNQENTSGFWLKDLYVYCQTHLAVYKQPQTIKIVSAIKKVVSGKNDRKKRGKEYG